MSDELARKKFTELKERTDLITDAELDDYWATCSRPPSKGCSANGPATGSTPATS